MLIIRFVMTTVRLLILMMMYSTLPSIFQVEMVQIAGLIILEMVEVILKQWITVHLILPMEQ